MLSGAISAAKQTQTAQSLAPLSCVDKTKLGASFELSVPAQLVWRTVWQAPAWRVSGRFAPSAPPRASATSRAQRTTATTPAGGFELCDLTPVRLERQLKDSTKGYPSWRL